MNCDCELAAHRRGGRAVDRAGLENRKAERPREFESHPLRFHRAEDGERQMHNVSHNKTAGPPITNWGAITNATATIITNPRIFIRD